MESRTEDRVGEVIGFTHFCLTTGKDDPVMTEYFYLKNAQGDIVGITNILGDIKARYTYDPWGRVISIEKNLDQYERDIVEMNPLLYRGYVYDRETDLYYLQSRYYDPQTGRFINCDDVNFIGITESEVSYNPFAYCFNNPIMFVDCLGFLGWPGEIHNAVVDDIVGRYPFLDKNKKINYANGKYGYCDIIYIAGKRIWEVKRVTISKTKALKQLDKYVNGTCKFGNKIYSGFRRGDSLISGRMFTHENGATVYTVNYWNAGDGIIYYQYYKTSKLAPNPESVKTTAMFLAAFYFMLGILTILTGGATAGAFLVPV